MILHLRPKLDTSADLLGENSGQQVTLDESHQTHPAIANETIDWTHDGLNESWTMDRKMVTVRFLTFSKPSSLLPICSFKVKILALVHNILMYHVCVSFME